MKAPAHFLRRPKHIPFIEVDKLAVALAHHRVHCHATCTQIESNDIEYADELVNVLDHLPDWPDGR